MRCLWNARNPWVSIRRWISRPLEKAHWGKGYASEAAEVALAYAFEALELAEVLSFTATANQRSESVMKKIGMLTTGTNFKHPDINAEHPLCEHLLYRITAQE